METKTHLSTIKNYIVSVTVFLVPFFFLTTTQEFFVTNKMYLLTFAGLALVAVSTLELLIDKRIILKRNLFDYPVLLFLAAVVLSTLFVANNKVQSLLNPTMGLVTIGGLSLMYYYISRSNITASLTNLLMAAGSIISVLTIGFFFQPFKNATLPASLQFLKNPYFTTIGSQIDLSIFLGFFLMLGLSILLTMRKKKENDSYTALQVAQVVLTFIALVLTIFRILKPVDGASLLLPPFRLSWFAAIETLKNPMSALFGVGVDNFQTMFTRVKDVGYNTSTLWQVYSFVISRSTLLHVLTVTGIVGIIAMGFMIFELMKTELNKSARNHSLANPYLLPILYMLIVLVLFPPSFMVMFLLYALTGLVASTTDGVENFRSPYVPDFSHNTAQPVARGRTWDLFNMLPLYFGILVAAIVFLIGTAYLLGRTYVAEYKYKRAFDGFAGDKNVNIYESQRQAILNNPFIERYHVDFSRVNLLLANNIAKKDAKSITAQDRQTIAQAIQAAISEAKAAVTLDPEKSVNWENLAVVYNNIINIAKGADAWTVTSYQRSIILDPQNPVYRLNLGGVYYGAGNYDESKRLFEQAVQLKPNWPNAYYNLAWSAYQKKDYVSAAQAMQAVISLLNPDKDKADLAKAQKDFEDFKSKIPQAQPQDSTKSADIDQKLALPTPAIATLEPKLELSPEASPEGR